MCVDSAIPLSSGVNLARFSHGLLACLFPCNAFRTVSLASLIAAGLTCTERGPLGSGRALEGWKLDGIKLSNVEFL